MDNITEFWLIRTDELASQYELNGDNKLLEQFSSDQLHFLIYWNWGYSGINKAPETIAAENELLRRDEEYNPEYAQLVVNKTEEYY